MLKEGVVEDDGQPRADREAAAFRVDAERRGEQTVSLSDYVGRMKDGQDAIYYITADSYPAARNSPHLEMFRKLGVEVLLMYDRVDEWLVSLLTEFDGKPLQSVGEGRARFEQAWRRRREATGDQRRREHQGGSSSACKASSRTARARSG